MSDFAKAQLLKYGWTEGKGLGKNENGIAQALKPKLKFDTSGVGHKDNEFHWWDSVYDKALKNIVLETTSDDVSINVAKENAFNISSTKTGVESSKKKHKLQYGKFLKSSTLQNGNMVKDDTCEVLEDDDTDNPTEIKITDEELFQACGGRTAHKGARHGLKLSGKLARIAEQEKQLLTAGYLKLHGKPEDKEIKQKKKKKRKRDMEVEDCTTNVNNNDCSLDNDDCLNLTPIKEDYKPSKKTRLKSTRKINDLVNQLNKSWSIDSNVGRDDQISSDQHGEGAVAQTVDQNLKTKKKEKKKKFKRKRDQEKIPTNDNTSVEPCQKRKKRKIEDDDLSSEKNHNNGTRITHECTNIDVNRINDKILRRKQRKYERKEKKKLEQLSKSLLAVNLDVVTETAIECSSKCTKKKRKKEKNRKKEKSANSELLN